MIVTRRRPTAARGLIYMLALDLALSLVFGPRLTRFEQQLVAATTACSQRGQCDEGVVAAWEASK
jgi:hypothetical protein